MPTPEQVSEARRALAAKITEEQGYAHRGGFTRTTVFLTDIDVEVLLAALRAEPARAAEEWNYDMDAAPPGPDVSVLVTVPSLHAGHPPIVGEAYYCADGQHKGWWWAGTSPSDYYASPICEANAHPIAWRRLPEPAAVRALAQEKGGGDA